MKSPLANHEECAGQAPDSSISEVPGAYPEVGLLCSTRETAPGQREAVVAAEQIRLSPTRWLS